MSKTKKDAIIWAVIGFVWSFLAFQGGAEMIKANTSVDQILALAYGTRKNIIYCAATTITFGLGRLLVNRGNDQKPQEDELQK